MKKLLIFTGLFLILCAKGDRNHKLHIKGQVARSYYMGSMTSDIEMHVWIVIENIGKDPIIFNKINTFWFSSGGGLPQVTMKEESNFIINPDQKHDFHFSTNGFTSKIVSAALEVNEPVQFGFNLSLNEQIIVGNYSAVLPNYSELPEYLPSEVDKVYHEIKFSSSPARKWH